MSPGARTMVLIAATWFVGVPSCERGPSPEAAVESAPEPWDWSRYPRASVVTLSEASSRVAAQRIAPFVAAVDGPIEIDDAVREAGAAGIELASGVEWGRVAPERLALERRAVAAERRQLELRRRLFEALERPRVIIEAERDLESARRTRDQLRLAAGSRDDPLIREVFPDLPTGFGDEVLDAAERLVEVLEENLRLARDPDASVDAIQLELAIVELEQAELQFERLAERSVLVMPFDGELVLRPELDTVGPLFVRSGDVIATARGGEVVLHVEAGEALWLDTPSERLEYRAQIPGGGRATARFDRRETIEIRGVQTLVDRYVVNESSEASSLRRLTGATVRGRLVERLDEPAYLVPKLDLIVRYPRAFRRADWSDGVAEIWPGSRVTAVGLTEVAIIPPPEPAVEEADATATVEEDDAP